MEEQDRQRIIRQKLVRMEQRAGRQRRSIHLHRLRRAGSGSRHWRASARQHRRNLRAILQRQEHAGAADCGARHGRRGIGGMDRCGARVRSGASRATRGRGGADAAGAAGFRRAGARNRATTGEFGRGGSAGDRFGGSAGSATGTRNRIGRGGHGLHSRVLASGLRRLSAAVTAVGRGGTGDQSDTFAHGRVQR